MRFQFRSAEGSREGGKKKPEARHNLPLSSTATKLLLQLHNVCCHLKAINSLLHFLISKIKVLKNAIIVPRKGNYYNFLSHSVKCDAKMIAVY